MVGPLRRPVTIIQVLSVRVLGLGEHLGLWVSQSYNAIHLRLIPPSEMPCIQDSTQIMLQPRSRRARVYDGPTDSDSTRTAPMSTKPLDCVVPRLFPTNSNRLG